MEQIEQVVLNPLAEQIEKVWMEAPDDQCQAFVDKLALELGVNRYHLYGVLTNLVLVAG